MLNFGIIDWIIIFIYLAITMSAGLAMRRHVSKVEDFILAGREMDLYLGIASLAATEFGIITAMYTAELGYKNGFAGATPGILNAVAMLLVGLTGFVIKPLRDSGSYTIPELLNQRFGPKVRWLAGLVIVLGGILNMGVFFRVGGEFLVIMSGIPYSYLEIIMTFLVVLVLIYTVLGGMLSVLVTDYLQFLVMGIGLVVVSLVVFSNTGWENVVTTVENQRGSGGFNPLTSEDMGPIYIVWQGFNQLAAVVTWQTVIQRVLAARTSSIARKIYTRTSFYFVGRFLIPAFWGMAALTVLGTNNHSYSSLQAMPIFLSSLLPTGLIGLLIAAMLAAEMSTDSSYLLTWSNILYNDLICPLRKQPFSEKTGLFLNRSIVVGIAGFLLLYGLWYQAPGRVWDYLSITANIYLSSIFVLLVSCCYWKGARPVGAVGAIIGGAIPPVVFLVISQIEFPVLTSTMSETLLNSTVQWLSRSEVSGLLSFGFASVGMILGSWISTLKESQRNQ